MDLLCIFVDFDLVDANDFGERARVLVEEGLAQIVKVLRSKLQEHLQLLPFDLFHHIFLVECLLESRLSFSTSHISPRFRAHHGLNEIELAAAIKFPEHLKLFWIVDFDVVICLCEYCWQTQLGRWTWACLLGQYLQLTISWWTLGASTRSLAGSSRGSSR